MQENMFRDWLSKRKITDSVITEFNIHAGTHRTIGECIVIPVKEGGFNKYRRSPLDKSEPKYLYDTGGKVSLYGWHKAKEEKAILITEGEMDCLVAWSANIPAVTSTGGAMSFQEEWVQLFKDKEVVVCFDNDKAGGEGMVKVLDLIPWAKILFLPDRVDIKDISDYAIIGGNLIQLIKTAKSFYGIEDVLENQADRHGLYQNTWFHDAYIKKHTKPVYVQSKRPFDKDRVSRARSYPIIDLLEFNQRKVRCLWHNEKTGSLTYFPKTNSLYCFGSCGRAYDAIDVYRQKYGCSFKEAINKLQ